MHYRTNGAYEAYNGSTGMMYIRMSAIDQPVPYLGSPELLGLDSVPGLQDTIARYRLCWLAATLREYSLSMVLDFFVSYAATIPNSLPKGKKPLT